MFAMIGTAVGHSRRTKLRAVCAYTLREIELLVSLVDELERLVAAIAELWRRPAR